MAQDIVGLALPAIRLNGGYFADNDPLDTAFGDLILALMCPRGGRFMRRSFGSDLDKSLFAPSDITLIGAVRDAIQTVARKWVSTISITALSVSIKHAEVSINVRFALASNASTERERLLVVPRQRAIQFLSAATR